MSFSALGRPSTLAGGVPYADGTEYALLPAGTSGQVLQSNGAAAPSWVSALARLGGARAHNATVGVSIASGSAVALSFDTNDFDSGVHSTSVNPTRFTVPTGGAGLYLLVGTLTFNGALGAHNYIFQIRKNGTTLVCNVEQDVTVTSAVVLPALGFDVAADADYYEFLAFQNTGSPQTAVAGLYQTFGAIVKLSQ